MMLDYIMPFIMKPGSLRKDGGDQGRSMADRKARPDCGFDSSMSREQKRNPSDGSPGTLVSNGTVSNIEESTLRL